MVKNKKIEKLARQYDDLLHKQEAEILRLAKLDEARQEKANKKRNLDNAKVYAKYKNRLDSVKKKFNQNLDEIGKK